MNEWIDWMGFFIPKELSSDNIDKISWFIQACNNHKITVRDFIKLCKKQGLRFLVEI